MRGAQNLPDSRAGFQRSGRIHTAGACEHEGAGRDAGPACPYVESQRALRPGVAEPGRQRRCPDAPACPISGGSSGNSRVGRLDRDPAQARLPVEGGPSPRQLRRKITTEPSTPADVPAPTHRGRRALLLAGRGAGYLVVLLVMASAIIWLIDRFSSQRPPVVAVLPVTADPASATDGGGIRSALMACLAEIGTVRVLARSAVESRPRESVSLLLLRVWCPLGHRGGAARFRRPDTGVDRAWWMRVPELSRCRSRKPSWRGVWRRSAVRESPGRVAGVHRTATGKMNSPTKSLRNGRFLRDTEALLPPEASIHRPIALSSAAWFSGSLTTIWGRVMSRKNRSILLYSLVPAFVLGGALRGRAGTECRRNSQADELVRSGHLAEQESPGAGDKVTIGKDKGRGAGCQPPRPERPVDRRQAHLLQQRRPGTDHRMDHAARRAGHRQRSPSPHPQGDHHPHRQRQG